MKEAVRNLRKSLKLTQKEFALKLGVSQPRITEVESKGFLNDSLKEKIEKTFNVVLTNDKPEITTNSNDLAVQELIKEINFLRNQLEKKDEQIEKKDELISVLSMKYLKFEVSNRPLAHKRSARVGNQMLSRMAA